MFDTSIIVWKILTTTFITQKSVLDRTMYQGKAIPKKEEQDSY